MRSVFLILSQKKRNEIALAQWTAFYEHRALRYRRIFLKWGQPRHHATILSLALLSVLMIFTVHTTWAVLTQLPFIALPVWLYGPRLVLAPIPRRSSRS
jgi:hypothetical protein